MTDYGYPSESRLMRKIKENPFVPIGLAGGLVIAAIGVFRSGKRGDKKLSVHLINTRLAAHGFVVGCMLAGVMYSIYQESFQKSEQQKAKENE